MRTVFSVVLGLVFLAILAGIGVSIYNAGVTAGLAQSGAIAGGAVAPYVHYGVWHAGFGLGFGFLGLLFPILFLFLIFGLIRAAIFGGRRGWHGGHGWHGGPGWDSGQGPDGWRSDRERAMADLHRRLHETEGSNPGTGSTGGPSSSGPAA
ncbi:MAG TPA: hypothetical protein VGI98_08105 [Candidatus Limnocylindrales bacterium]|jgi:hypothetical protein